MVSVRAYAKLNLSLEVLNKRPDGFHNLRTLFQSISLHDSVGIEAKRSRTTRVTVSSDVEIPGENLIVRAAHAVLEALGFAARVEFTLRKRIPMGGGLGGGSTDAAAVLLSLPGILGRRLSPERLRGIASSLGSDVPFFLVGGTALGLGRGTEIYPLPDAPAAAGLLIVPGVHVSTATAFGQLYRSESELTRASSGPAERIAFAWATGEDWAPFSSNDFEDAVFGSHPELGRLRAELQKYGARPARMSGSGSTLFGLFGSRELREAAARQLPGVRLVAFRFVTRRRYRSAVGGVPAGRP